jgi:Trichohyalin-plectin-homology domain
LQTGKQQELAQLRTAEENDLATAVLDQHAKEQRERGEIAELHAKHETLREYDPMLRFMHHFPQQNVKKLAVTAALPRVWNITPVHKLVQHKLGITTWLASLQSGPNSACSLASKLKTAQVTRERHLQLQEKTILQTQAREYDNMFAEKMEKQRQQAVIAEDEKQHLRRLDNFKTREKLEVGIQTTFTDHHSQIASLFT